MLENFVSMSSIPVLKVGQRYRNGITMSEMVREDVNVEEFTKYGKVCRARYIAQLKLRFGEVSVKDCFPFFVDPRTNTDP